MLHEENSSRDLVWIEGPNVEAWGCSECAWVFNPSGPPSDGSLDLACTGPRCRPIWSGFAAK